MKKITGYKKNLTKNLITKFPLYSSSLMNLSNSTGNLTSKKNIGTLHEYFNEFKNLTKKDKSFEFSVEGWKNFYLNNKNGKEILEKVVEKNLLNIEKFKSVLQKIDKSLIKEYIYDLVFKKTFIGLDAEYLAVSLFAKQIKEDVSLIKKANYQEESKGIDMWIKNIPFQVKHISYKSDDSNIIKVGIVLYYKYENKNSIFVVSYDEKNVSDVLKKIKNEKRT